MRVRFLADADLNVAIVTGVVRREPAINFLTAQDAGLRGMSDPDVLELGRHHAETFPSIHGVRRRKRRRSPDSADPSRWRRS